MLVRRMFCLSLFALLIGSSVTGLLTPRADAAPPKKAPPPQVFEIEYFWGWPSLPPVGTGPTATLLLYHDGSFTAIDHASGDTGSGTWYSRRGGREIVFEINGIALDYIGDRVSPGNYEGTMAVDVPNGPEGVWRGRFVP